MPAGAVFAQPASSSAVAANSGPAAEFGRHLTSAKAVMMSDPGSALRDARAAIEIGKGMSGSEARIAIATGQWLEGEALIRLNRAKEARKVITDALAVAVQDRPGSKLHADLLKANAAIANETGDLQSALTSLHQAHRIFGKLGERRSQAIVYQNIGSIYSEARDYQRVLYYYDLANETYGEDPNLSLAAHNNRGNAFKEMGKLADALREFRIALGIARKIESPLLEARIITNIASAQYLNGELAAAEATALSGLALAEGDAAEWRPFLWGIRAQIAYKQGQIATAQNFIERSFAQVDLAQTSGLYRDFHDTAQQIYAAEGRNDLALIHLKALKRLDDETYGITASAQSALMAAQFDATNQELRLVRLKQAKLMGEVKLARSSRRLRSAVLFSLYGGIAALAIIVAISIAFIANRRARLKVTAANDQLAYAANHDGLTDLANRGYFRALLGEAISHASAHAQACTLFLIDLDRFKAVNDTFGHQIGDTVLRTVAERLGSLVAGRGCAGRLGGDEFAAFLPFSAEINDPEEFAAEVVAALSKPIEIDGRLIETGATVGMASFPLDGSSIDQLSRCADLALYHAKDAGRGRSAKFVTSMQLEVDERSRLERDLRGAIKNSQLVIAYQPIVDATTREVVAQEALLRWEHPELGAIPPAVFIPIAEEAKLIDEIGKWVLRTACAEAQTWPGQVKLAVNLSAIQIEGADLTANIVHALAASGLTVDRLVLEITESAFLRQGASTDATLARLQSLGISLALDDFGTGFSSLSYLQRATFSTIKIDRSFVQKAVEGHNESLSIIQAILALARGLKMDTVAEGVETEEQITLMRSLGCTQLQGYHIGKPMFSTGEEAQSTGANAPSRAPRRRALRRTA